LLKFQALSEVAYVIGQRYNYRKRVDRLLNEDPELKFFNDHVLRGGGFIS